MNPTEKTCFKCCKTLPLEAFYKHKMMRDGRLNKCKVCTKKDVTEHRLLNLDRIRQYDKMRSSIPHRMKNNAKVNREYAAKYPHRKKANCAVNNAVRDGRLKKLPCFICGSEKVVGHHPDYDQPLDVVWLCQPHHKAAHALIKD